MDVLTRENLKALLLLNRLGIEGRRRTLALFAEGKSPGDVSSFFEPELAEIRKELLPEKELALCWQKGISLLTILDPAYPRSLKEIPDPPLVLYMKGELAEGDADSVAVVGTRHPSFYGRTQAKKFAGELAAKGLTIVSGLARGIDQVAHEAALGVPYGRTIAVLGSGLDVIYPKENEKLYRQISERGAVLSEYALGTPPLAENFPRRNRILSGLALGVFVAEAHSRSGSLITAHQAVDQGREVFALPGPVDQLTSRGTHQLLKEGAALVETPEDIFEALAVHLKKTGDSPDYHQSKENKSQDRQLFGDAQPTCPILPVSLSDSQERGQESHEKKSQPTSAEPLTEEEAVILDILKEEAPLGADDLLDISGIEPGALPVLLLKLELAGKVKKSPDGKYSLK